MKNVSMNCPNNFSSYNSLREECINCKILLQCKEGKVVFQSKEVIKKTYNVPDKYGEWYPYFMDELLSLKSEYFMREAELRMMFYHELGKRLVEEVLDYKPLYNVHDRAKYGEKILHECAKCLEIAESNIYASIKFYRMYPKIDDCPAVNWTSAKKLIANDGDTKVLKECNHSKTEMRRFCLSCHRWVRE